MSKPGFCLAAAAAQQLGGSETLGCDVKSDADLVKAVESGFPMESLGALAGHGVTQEEIGRLIINLRTLSHRRERGQRLTVEESDRAARVARTVALAERTFASRDKAQRWLHRELHALEERRPIDLVRTHAGSLIVENALMRIAWGVPS